MSLFYIVRENIQEFIYGSNLFFVAVAQTMIKLRFAT